MTPSEARRFYEARAKSTIKNIREQKQLSFKELARRLEAVGVQMSDQVLINRVNRGNYSFAFALQLLAVMGVDILEVPKLPEERARVP
jgi:transcriptional regulator with XRE-family HTH domain